MLHEFVTTHRDELIDRCRAKVLARSVPPPTSAEVEHGVPTFLDELVDALQNASSSADIDQSAARHGRDLQAKGFTVSQVVHDYGDVCQSITDMAVELGAPISVEDFRTLNRCLDDAIASAVTEHGRGRSSLDADSLAKDEHIGFLAHEIRNLVNTASLAFEVLKTGNVGVGGSTGAVLSRSLIGLRDLMNQSVAEVRLRHSMQARVPIVVADLVQEVAAAAALEAVSNQRELTVDPGEAGVAVHADRQTLSAVLVNLLQNAFKFTRPQTTVALSVHASAERVRIEVADECGGLHDVDPETLFRPFEQRHADRSGLGLGLAFCRWGAGVNGGTVYARNRPGRGCVFTVDLPRVPVSAFAVA